MQARGVFTSESDTGKDKEAGVCHESEKVSSRGSDMGKKEGAEIRQKL
jgi:hypothetical protein